MKTTAHSPVHPPEGNVWNHTMLVVDEAAKRRAESKDPAALMWAALLHDVGKPDTTRVRKGKITSYGHETLGAELARRFLQRFSADQDLIGRVCALIRYHMQVLFVGKGMPFADVNGMRENADLEEVALLGLCDRYGPAERGCGAGGGEHPDLFGALRPLSGGGTEWRSIIMAQDGRAPTLRAGI